MAHALVTVVETEIAAHGVTDSDNINFVDNFGKFLYIMQARRFIWMVRLIPAILKDDFCRA